MPKAAGNVSLEYDQSVTMPYLSATKVRDSETQVVEQAGELLKDIILRIRKPGQLEGAETRKMGDRTFYGTSGYWIDQECIRHPDSNTVEIASPDPEYESILAQYPALPDLRPVLIHWKGTNFLMR